MGKKAVIIIIGILLLDQLVKILVKTQMAPPNPGEYVVIENFFQLTYIENKGMAFGTTLGAGVTAKYALSIFRLLAIFGIGFYIKKMIKEGASMSMIVSISLIFAGATGNLIDSMFYDYIWELNPNISWNWAEGSDGNWILDDSGMPVLRERGFLLASVVDMFQFTAVWPSWMPWGLDGEPIFAAIWNVADVAITSGVGLIILRYKKFFKKPVAQENVETAEGVTMPVETEINSKTSEEE